MCFECDNCVIYCPQDAVFRVKKDEATLGRYVDTDYNKCIGCHICADVCPTGYIKMGLGEQFIAFYSGENVETTYNIITDICVHGQLTTK